MRYMNLGNHLSAKWKPRWLTRWQWRQLVGREFLYLRGLTERGVIPGLVEPTFSSTFANASKDFFFVLGNGDTVNELTDEDFSFIRGHFSVGLNAWPLHPFVPSAYGFEMWSGLDRHSDELDFLLKTATEKAKSRSSALWILRPKPEQLESLARVVGSDGDLTLQVYGRANLGPTPAGELRTAIVAALDFLTNPGLDSQVLLDNGASVVRMISLALLNGFKRVVLVGVDLKANPYFWYNPGFISKHGHYTEICRREPEEGTDTLHTRDRPFSAHEFIVSMATVAKYELGCEILVSSNESALAGALEVFHFPDRNSNVPRGQAIDS